MATWADIASLDLDESRKRLVESLRLAIISLERMGVSVEVALIGGSFCNTQKSPVDMDCVLFYQSEVLRPVALSEWSRAQSVSGLDLRMIPMDMDGADVLKIGMYFATLYSQRKPGDDSSPSGVILLRCDGFERD
ncbi:DUF6932 family protein [Stenotrophomonas lactitubi]|jgi:hypothetical protein|uniref:DUF6932 family protein n=1 Tax=Stenotrophomonas lactitubi TaxID=2045214 RepID=UPI003CE5B817